MAYLGLVVTNARKGKIYLLGGALYLVIHYRVPDIIKYIYKLYAYVLQ